MDPGVAVTEAKALRFFCTSCSKTFRTEDKLNAHRSAKGHGLEYTSGVSSRPFRLVREGGRITIARLQRTAQWESIRDHGSLLREVRQALAPVHQHWRSVISRTQDGGCPICADAIGREYRFGCTDGRCTTWKFSCTDCTEGHGLQLAHITAVLIFAEAVQPPDRETLEAAVRLSYRTDNLVLLCPSCHAAEGKLHIGWRTSDAIENREEWAFQRICRSNLIADYYRCRVKERGWISPSQLPEVRAITAERTPRWSVPRKKSVSVVEAAGTHTHVFKSEDEREALP